MLAFIRREADILVSTTIIESGMDIPSANTMFVHDATPVRIWRSSTSSAAGWAAVGIGPTAISCSFRRSAG